MSEDLPEVSDREMVKLLAVQMTLMDNQLHPDESHGSVSKAQLKEEYVSNIKDFANRYGVEVNV